MALLPRVPPTHAFWLDVGLLARQAEAAAEARRARQAEAAQRARQRRGLSLAG
jgi:hypothetical protein